MGRRQHAVPVMTVSPTGGGSVEYSALPDETVTEYGATVSTRRYVYTAKPSPGYRFVRFEISVVMQSSSLGRQVYNINTAANPYESHDMTDGASYWDEVPDFGGWQYVESIVVRAVFELRNSGRLVFSPANGGRLVYSVAQGGALAYDG